MRGYIPPLSFAALLGLLSLATVVGVGAAVVTRHTLLIPVVIGVAIAVGVLYIALTYSRPEPLSEESPAAGSVGAPAGPGAPPSPSGAAAAGSPAPTDPGVEEGPDLDPEYDPVEEADRLDSAPGGVPPPSGDQDPK